MSWALATAGGKDATLALHRARAQGMEVRWALAIFEGNTDLIRFHGTSRGLLEAQARALGLEPCFGSTHPADFEAALGERLEVLVRAGATGVIFGNLHLADIRDWYEARVRAHGLEHREPLWGQAPEQVVRDVVTEGFRARIVSVNLEMVPTRWLGRALDLPLMEEFRDHGIDPCGERGEYHTFVHDGPGFRVPVALRSRGWEEREGHRYLTW